MTLEEIKALDKDLLTPHDVCEVLHCAQYALTQTAKEYPERIKFPFAIIKSRMKIPRIPFIKFMEGHPSGKNEN